MKLLIVNLQNPCDSKYMDYRKVGSYMLGRRLRNYGIFIVRDGIMVQVPVGTGCVITIQNTVNSMWNYQLKYLDTAASQE